MTICIKINQSYAKLHTPTAASSSQAQVIGYRWVILQKACWSDPLYYVKKIHWGWQGKIKSNTNMYKNINTITDFDICDVVVLKVYFKYDWNYSVIDIYIYACIILYIRKLVPSLAEVLQPFTSKFTTGGVSTSLFLDARWQERCKWLI